MIDSKLLKEYNQTRYQSSYRKYLSPFSKFCYAPFSSLYFGHQGKVTACCENRQHELGTFPKNTVSQIWKGEQAALLRKYIAENNLWHGCRGCELDLKSKNFDGIHAKIFDDAGANQSDKDYPSLMEFELENTCNLECVMCSGIFSSSIRKNRENLPPIISPYNDEFVRQLEEFIPHLSKANFFGGEPFLIPIYYQVWDKMAELNPDINVWVITNGSILNNRVKDLLNKIRFNITMSIDSMNKENYEKIRVNSNLDKVMEHFKYFNEYTKSIKSELTINTCPMPPNWKDLPHIVKTCNEQHIVVKILPVKHPEHMSLRSLSSGELYKVLDYFQSFDFKANDYYSTRNKKQYEDYLNLIAQWLNYNKSQEEIENSSSQTLTNPKEKLFKKISSHIGVSSSSEKFKEEQAQSVFEKINKVELLLKEKNTFLGEAIINIANRSTIDEVVNAAIFLSQEKMISETKELFIEELDNTKNESASTDDLFQKLETYSHILEVCSDPESVELNNAIARFEKIHRSLNELGHALGEELVKSAHRAKIKQLFDSLTGENEFQIIEDFSHDFLLTLNEFYAELQNSNKEKLDKRIELYFNFLKVTGNQDAGQFQEITLKSDRIYNTILNTDKFLAEAYLLIINAVPIESYVDSLTGKSEFEAIVNDKQNFIVEINKCFRHLQDSDKQKLLHKIDAYFNLLSLCNEPGKNARQRVLDRFEKLEASLSVIDSALAVNLIRIANRSDIQRFVSILLSEENTLELENKTRLIGNDAADKKRLIKKLEIYFSLLEIFNDLKSDDRISVISKFEKIEKQLSDIEEFLASALYRFADQKDVEEITANDSSIISIAKPFLIDEISQSYRDSPLSPKEKFLKKLHVYFHLLELCENGTAENWTVFIESLEKIEKDLAAIENYLADAFYSFVNHENLTVILSASGESLLKKSMPALIEAISRSESHLPETDPSKLYRKIETYFKLKMLHDSSISAEESGRVIQKFEKIKKRLSDKSPMLGEALVSIANKGLINGLADSLLQNPETQAIVNAKPDIVNEILSQNNSASLKSLLQNSNGSQGENLKKVVTDFLESV